MSTDRITRDDLEDKFRELEGEVQEQAASARSTAISAGVVAARAGAAARLPPRAAQGQAAHHRRRDPAGLSVAGLRDRTRTDRLLQFLQSHGVRRRLYGSSRAWLYVALGAYVLRRARRAVGSEAALVYRGELRPGETIRIAHKPETYAGKKVRSRRRTPV